MHNRKPNLRAAQEATIIINQWMNKDLRITVCRTQVRRVKIWKYEKCSKKGKRRRVSEKWQHECWTQVEVRSGPDFKHILVVQRPRPMLVFAWRGVASARKKWTRSAAMDRSLVNKRKRMGTSTKRMEMSGLQEMTRTWPHQLGQKWFLYRRI